MQDARDPKPVARPGPAKREQRQSAWVFAAFDGVHPGGAGHAFVDELMHAPGSAGGVHPQRLGDLRSDGLFRGTAIERHASAQEEIRVQVAEQQVGVGDRRFSAAAAVARWARVGASALRPDLQKPKTIDPRDGPTAGANLDQVDHRHLDG